MKSILSIMVVLFLVFPAAAGKVEGRGMAWLEEHKDAPQVNVTGTWDSSDWGALNLIQAEGSRDVNGTNKKHVLVGVVSGRTLYLLFANGGGSVSYCATLTSDSETSLIGTYSYPVTRLKLGHGLCQSKGYPLRLKKSSTTPAPKK